MLLIAIIACSGDKGWETGMEEELADTSEDGDVPRADESCNGYDLAGEVWLQTASGEVCTGCASQLLTMVSTLTNPCETEVGTIFESDCDVSSWVIRDSAGAETFRYDQSDCGTQQRRVDLEVGETLTEVAPENGALVPGSYTLEAQWDDASHVLATSTVEIIEQD